MMILCLFLFVFNNSINNSITVFSIVEYFLVQKVSAPKIFHVEIVCCKCKCDLCDWTGVIIFQKFIIWRYTWNLVPFEFPEDEKSEWQLEVVTIQMMDTPFHCQVMWGVMDQATGHHVSQRGTFIIHCLVLIIGIICFSWISDNDSW